MAIAELKALTFDVFGTVLDWKGTIVSEGGRIVGEHAPGFDWDAFADEWMRSYGHSVAALKGWTNLDTMLWEAFFPLARRSGLDRLLNHDEAVELAGVWSRLKPWPDAVAGFDRLRGHVQLIALTNANISMLASLATSSGLPWDQLLSAEHARHYKPHPSVYRTALDTIGWPAEQVMMVASHTFDLNAAHLAGMKTALISRKGEPDSDPAWLDHTPEIIAEDLDHFAKAMLGSQ